MYQPLSNHYQTYRDNQSVSTPRMAKPHSESRKGKSNQPQRHFRTPPTSRIHSQEDPYHLQNENKIITRNSITNPGKDHFNNSLLMLLSDQQDLQKHSLNMMQDKSHRHDYDNLIRDIPIYDGKIWNLTLQTGCYRLKK